MAKKKIERTVDGLIKGVKYVFTEDGLIDWRKMVKPEFLVSNRQRTKETDVTKLEDRDLLILLGGIKELAQIRGYTSVRYDVHTPSPDYVVTTCSISWIPNYETEGRDVVFSAIGDASPSNTQSFAKFFLGPIAENRAFVRCVRNFLKINIVGQEELGNAKLASEESSDENTADPKVLLEKVMKEKGLTFEVVKKKLIKEDFDDVDSIKTLADIPKMKTFELIQRIKKMGK
jgi:hypothetical protein